MPFYLYGQKLFDSCQSKFYLFEDNNEELKTDHAYYYQVQMQMKFAHAQYCSFLVWRKNEFIIDRILPDVSFIDNALAKASQNSIAARVNW